MFYAKRQQYTEVMETVWRPGKNSPSLLGDGYGGSSLGNLSAPTQGNRGSEKRTRIMELPASIANAKKDFAYYEGKL